MDYEKAYNEAIKRAKAIIEVAEKEEEVYKSAITIFPELREGKEERTINCIGMCLTDANEQRFKDYGTTLKDCLAWLEKQGTSYTKRDVDDAFVEGMAFAKHELEKQGEQKSVDKVEPFDKYEGLTDFERTLADICIGWIGEEPGWKQYIKDNADVLLKIAIEKFNSVQDTLFEQKPAWSEEDIRNIQDIDSILFYDKDLPEETCMRLRNWLKSLKPHTDMVEALRTEYEKGRADTLSEMKSSWSEEDEVRLQACLDTLQAKSLMGKIDTVMTEWLKSLKDRVILQPKHEWSIEDERVIAIINNALTESNTPPDDYDKVYDWLESIKQRIGWKPSNEQIEALEHFVRSIGESGYASPYDNNTKLLYSLLEQLKKLKA